jgi:ADP-ribosylglycohydrolase
MTKEQNLIRMKWSLEGLSTGDAFGDSLFFSRREVDLNVNERLLPSAVWEYTDDTQMAFSIIETLRQFGKIDQDYLAESFAKHFERNRGYGTAMYELLPVINSKNWKQLAQRLFGGQGSYGNGGAMRVAPLGAYFAEDIDMAVENARLSAEVTHAHLEGIAGAIAVAVSAAIAWQFRKNATSPNPKTFMEQVASFTPPSIVHDKILLASSLSFGESIWEIIRVLGNGSGVSAQDTAPFAIWCASQHLDNFEEAIWLTASGHGDMDTNCAIVGGIVASYTGAEGIPAEWIRRREKLPAWVFEN